jgi:YD repeat-containing protein
MLNRFLCLAFLLLTFGSAEASLASRASFNQPIEITDVQGGKKTIAYAYDRAGQLTTSATAARANATTATTRWAD